MWPHPLQTQLFICTNINCCCEGGVAFSSSFLSQPRWLWANQASPMMSSFSFRDYNVVRPSFTTEWASVVTWNARVVQWVLNDYAPACRVYFPSTVLTQSFIRELTSDNSTTILGAGAQTIGKKSRSLSLHLSISPCWDCSCCLLPAALHLTTPSSVCPQCDFKMPLVLSMNGRRSRSQAETLRFLWLSLHSSENSPADTVLFCRAADVKSFHQWAVQAPHRTKSSLQFSSFAFMPTAGHFTVLCKNYTLSLNWC